MSTARLLLVAVLAFLAGTVNAVLIAWITFSAAPPNPPGWVVMIPMAGFFAGGIVTALLLGRRFSAQTEAKTAEPAPTPMIAPGDDEEVAALRTELFRPPQGKHLGLIAAILLAIYLLHGLTEGTVRSVAVIVAVLLVHEGGHALGMLAFGYRDVRVFFLPFVGAMTTGRKDDAPSWQHAVVLLMGPMPGIVMGIVLLIATDGTGLVGEIARAAIYVNVFNLLPFEPLDGGRLLGVTLFSRSRWIETAFGLIGALALAAAALKLGAWIIALVALSVVIGLPHQLRVAGSALRLKDRGIQVGPRVETLPANQLAALSEEVRRLAPQQFANIASRAAVVRTLHARMRFSPPGILATALLLGAYGGGVLLSLVALVLTAPRPPVAKPDPIPAAIVGAPPSP